jgi:spermidine synthase
MSRPTRKRLFLGDISFYSPASFVGEDDKYDLILLINVLNTIPEEEHRRQVFDHLARRLNPTGWLLVYQRIWSSADKPVDKLPYMDGWLVPQTRYDYYTYRAKTGAIWFNLRAEACGLKAVRIKTRITSNNTLLRVWEKKLKK